MQGKIRLPQDALQVYRKHIGYCMPQAHDILMSACCITWNCDMHAAVNADATIGIGHQENHQEAAHLQQGTLIQVICIGQA